MSKSHGNYFFKKAKLSSKSACKEAFNLYRPNPINDIN